MNAPSVPVTENVADLDSGATENEFPNGDDLAISRATDFYSLDELLTDQERQMRDRGRQWCDTEGAPAAAGYWERGEVPVELAKGYGRLGIAGASIVGNGCPGVSFLAEGVIAAELARGDGSIATLNAVHSGLGTTPTMCWPSPGRPSPGRPWATRPPPMRQHSLIRCDASSSGAHWPGSS